MNAHDWTRVDDGIFHDFHQTWAILLKMAIRRLLPAGFYVAADQRIEKKFPDVMALHATPPEALWPPLIEQRGGAVAFAEAPPKAVETRPLIVAARRRGRTLTVRHKRGHRVVAFVDLVSPSNKNTETGVTEFLNKVIPAVRGGIHVAVVDMLPPTKRAPNGMLGLVEEELVGEASELPEGKPLCFASYRAVDPPLAYIQSFAVGESVPGLPLALTPDYYLDLPLARTYAEAFEEVPDFAKDLLEAPPA